MNKLFLSFRAITKKEDVLGNTVVDVNTELPLTLHDIREVEKGLCEKFGYNNVVLINYQKAR